MLMSRHNKGGMEKGLKICADLGTGTHNRWKQSAGCGDCDVLWFLVSGHGYYAPFLVSSFSSFLTCYWMQSQAGFCTQFCNSCSILIMSIAVSKLQSHFDGIALNEGEESRSTVERNNRTQSKVEVVLMELHWMRERKIGVLLRETTGRNLK